jgi:hypothetical protein
VIKFDILNQDGGMLIMDATTSSSKSRQANVVYLHHAVASSHEVPVSKPPKALAPQVLSSLPADEAPMKPVFVKRDKRETRTTEPSKRSHEVTSGSIQAKKALCSFDDE